jgi:hypothetical protein
MMRLAGRGVLQIMVLAVLVTSPLSVHVPTTAGAATSPSSWAPVYNQDFPDPWVSRFNGTYYAYSTGVLFASVPGATSTDGVNWMPVSDDIFPTVPSWGTFGFTWSPSVEKNASGQYVMYYSQLDLALGTMCIGRATSDSPVEPFSDPNSQPVLCQSGLGGSIDPHFFIDKTGQGYLLWKSDSNAKGMLSGLWAEPLNPDFDLVGSSALLLVDTQAWQDGVIEGPTMVQVGSGYDLFYAGNQFESAHSAIGYAICASPLGPCTDSPSNPVLVSGVGMSGPQGGDFFTAPDGQLRMAFAAWPGAVGYANGGVRAMYEANVGFTNGVPTLEPVNPVPGYWEVASDGGVFSFGNAGFFGSTGGLRLNRPVDGIGATPDSRGYWLVASDGGVFNFGDAVFSGSMGGKQLNAPVVGIAPTPSGSGYWLVASDGGIFSFGDAVFSGSMGGQPLNKPVVGIAADSHTGGYWQVASDGGIFSFDAPYYGSAGAMKLNKPVVGMASTPDGRGYWLVASDGGIFSFDAPFYGSAGAMKLNKPVVGMASTPDGRGYWLVASDGGIFSFGDAPSYGPIGALVVNQPIVGMTATPSS